MAKVGRPNMQVINQIDLDDIPKILPLLSLAEQEQLLAELDKLEKLDKKSRVKNSPNLFIIETNCGEYEIIQIGPVSGKTRFASGFALELRIIRLFGRRRRGI